MSEEEAIDILKNIKKYVYPIEDKRAIEFVIDLYKKQKERLKLLQDAYDKRVFEIMDLESRVEELEEENFAIKEQKKYLISTTNKDILKYWRKK